MIERNAQPQADVSGPGAAPGIDAGALRCQWCSVTLSPGITICPTCGSAGIADPLMTVPDAEPAPEPVSPQPIELVEWWREDEADGKPARVQMSFVEAERRRQQTIVFIAVAVLACAITGWLAGPLLAGAMESLTGTPVENTSDLRPTGGFLGTMIGFMVGAAGGWLIWSGK